MGTISYWMTNSVLGMEAFAGRNRPLSLDEALAALELTIERVDARWVLHLQGFPREWHETETDALEAAERWHHMEPTVEHAPGPTWLVYGGDQYQFTSTSQEEAEGFVYGVAVGMYYETSAAEERDRRKRP